MRRTRSKIDKHALVMESGAPASGDVTNPHYFSHPDWCVRQYCRGIQHVSRRFMVEGDVPLVVELYQPVEETEPLLSILERDTSGFVTIAAAQARDLAAILVRADPKTLPAVASPRSC